MRKLNSFVAVSSLAVAFLLGIIAGVAIDVKERKNTVRMAVQYDSSEVYVAPFVGDTVQWFKVAADGSFKQVETDFGGGGDPSMSPCDPMTSDKFHCHIRKPDSLRDRYRYHCKLYTCIDPGGGPQSTTGGDFMEAEHQFWQILILDIEGLLHLQQTSFAVPGPGGPGTGGITPKAIVGPPISMQVGCPGNKFTVYGPDGTTNPINAMPNNQIIWATTANPLIITDTNSLCSGDTSDLANTGCIINATAKGKYTYTASSTDAKCSSGNSSTQTVVLP